MSHLPDLISLNASNNQISWIFPPSKKKVEESSGDQIETKWKSLTVLDLSFNRIIELEDFRFPVLRELNLSSNEIRKIENVEGAENLEILKLNNNQIVDVSKIKGVRKLRELYLVWLSGKQSTEITCQCIPTGKSEDIAFAQQLSQLIRFSTSTKKLWLTMDSCSI